ncbi:aminotransferase class V-fold PLP-dependent enzyme [Nonomuraea phyllanthi]|uniref:aminotransferase class V-fold PLP-dependent enzyme n=1 Tax=Nonomuraea phyllanthi TaxID=2219224 RepID=UPI001D14EDB6|nr:aminotransferase class V-fold PLP-dependent enzyme [Nonomuraea phyllanthi]
MPPGHLDAAGCNVPSDRVMNAVVSHLRLERERGGYAAAPDLTPARSALAALVGAGPEDVAFLENGTAAMAALLGGWRLPPGSRVGYARTEYGSTLMLLRHLAAHRGWKPVELPVDADGRLTLEGLGAGLDLVIVSHIASHRGIVQPAAEIGARCRAAGVPFVLDVCQSLGHVEVRGANATAYVGTSRKWLAGPRGVGFLIVPGLTPAMDAAVPTLGGHLWTDSGEQPGELPAMPYEQSGELRAGLGERIGELRAGLDEQPGALRAGLDERAAEHRARPDEQPQQSGEPRIGLHERVGEPVPQPGAVRYESSEAAMAARAGLGVAAVEQHAIGPAAIHAHLAELGRAARGVLDGAGGWRVVEPADEPSALVTLRPPPGDTAEAAAARAAEASLLVGVVPRTRAPLDLTEPVLRVSPPPGTPLETLEALARVLAR